MNLQVSQKDGLNRMLYLNGEQKIGDDNQHLNGAGAWKILVYDDYCQNILAPLFNVQELREKGITLHLPLSTPRQRVPDVPAVYFVEPTKDNIRRICEDMRRGLYESFYLNFSSSLPRGLLEALATQAVESDAVARVEKVFDQYSHFISLERDLFSLNFPNSFVHLNDKGSEESMKLYLDNVVESLFCMLVTVGSVPIIRCPSGTASEFVGKQLNTRLSEHLRSRTNLFAEGSLRRRNYNFQRPLLVILDRVVDCSAPLHHTCTYQAMMHDLLDLKSNRVTLKEPGKKNVVFDLDAEDDPFWRENAGKDFPDVAEGLKSFVERYQHESNRVTQSAGSGDHDESQSLSSAISRLPEMQKSKRQLDMHTNIATAVSKHIKERNLAEFFNMEEYLMHAGRINQERDGEAVHKLLRLHEATGLDKLRLYMIYYLCNPSANKLELEKMEHLLKRSGVDLSPLVELKRLRRMYNIGQTISQGETADEPRGLFENLTKHITGKISEGVKNLLPSKKDMVVTRIVSALMANDKTPPAIIEKYRYLDPKAQGNRVTHASGPFSDVIVFVLGGGAYTEFQNLKDMATRTSTPKSTRRLLYGCMDMPNPEEFVAQLAKCGRSGGPNLM